MLGRGRETGRHSLEGGKVMGRFDEIHTFQAHGETPLAQMLDLVLLADVVAAVLVSRADG